MVVLVWGSLAFGGIYATGYVPLFAGSTLVGILGLYAGRAVRPLDRPLLLGLVVLAAATALQLVPVPRTLLVRLSPAADRLLRQYDLGYAMGSEYHPLSIEPELTAVALALICSFGVLFLGLLRVLTASRVRQLVAVVSVFGVLLALFGIIQKAVFGDDVYDGMRMYGIWNPGRMAKPFGPFVNRNNFAGWMMLAAPLALCMAIGRAQHAAEATSGNWRRFVAWLSTPDGGRVLLFLAAVTIMSASVLLSQSRSGVVGLAAAVVSVGIIGRRHIARRGLWWMVAAISVVFVLTFAWVGGDLLERVWNPAGEKVRVDIWRDTLAVIRDFPLAGTGLLTFSPSMLYYQSSAPELHFNAAHNSYLQLASEGGLLIGLPAVAFVLQVASRMRRRFAAGTDDPTIHWTRVGALAGIIGIAAQSVVEFSLQIPGVCVLFVLVVAIAIYEPRRPQTGPGAPRNNA